MIFAHHRHFIQSRVQMIDLIHRCSCVHLCPRSIAIYISTMMVIGSIIFLLGSTDHRIDDSIDITVILQTLVRRSLDVIRLDRSLI